MNSPISGTEASRLILDSLQHMPVERVPLAAAQDKILAETITASVSIPPWRSASMDGYAVMAADIAKVPCTLRVAGDISAGGFKPPSLADGTAVRIMTGAPVPEGADTVIRVEDTNHGTQFVEVLNARDALRNVRPLGEDFRAGDVLLSAGERVGAAALGVLASSGNATVSVHRAPTVSIVASGDELVRVDDFAGVINAERIVSSNSYSLPALVRDAGGLPRDGGITQDDPQALRNAIEEVMACDLLITTGGVSVGERDFTRHVMREMGVDVKFWRVRIRPGGPLVFGTLDGLPWIGLPGNPVSAMVTFELFVRPAIRKMLGQSLVFPVPQLVTLDEQVNLSGDLAHYLRVVVRQTDDGLHARLTGSQSSGVLTSMMRANALLIVPEGKRECKAGDQFRALLSRGSMLRCDTFPA
ncbi:MAG: gephyrin-like molybdotransferase Glp [Gemmatimonadaceae bacterium]